MGIKINNQSIAKLYLGNIAVKRAYSNGAIVYDTGGNLPCFEVVDTISHATGNYIDVYAWDTEKWYKRNNLSQYEEYGIIQYTSNLSTITYYVGKLAILTGDNHEYKWNGTQWVDLGEVTGTILPAGYTAVDHVTANGSQYIQTNYYQNLNSEFIVEEKLTGQVQGHIFSGQSYRAPYVVYYQGTAYRIYTYAGTGHNADVGISYYNRKVKFEAYDHKLYMDGVLVESNMTGSVETDTVASTIFGWGPQPTDSDYHFIGELYKLVVKENGVIIKNYIPCKNSNNIYGLYETISGTFLTSNSSTQLSGGGDAPAVVVPEEYDTKVAPANNVHYNTLAELELMECPWIGMQATVGSNYIPYLYTVTGWMKQYTPCFEVVNTISQASGDYVDVYVKSGSKWYKRNNLSQYEEYGVMPIVSDLSSVTTYTGKLAILNTNKHEYEWNGTTWADLGECEGEIILPDGYTQYQAIANNGNAYINTGYIPSNKTRILADMQITTSTTYGRLWGSGQWNEYRSIHLDYENNTTGTIHGKWGTENTWNVNSNVRGDFNRHVYDMYDHYLYRDGDLVLTFASGTFTSQHNLAIFTYYNYGTPGSSEWINGRLYSFKIYDNGTLVRDFIPCKRDSDSKAGAYDIVNNVFYPSSSSKQFSTYGDPYDPLTPVEDYDTKVAPSDNVHYDTLEELELMECPWIGMTATIGQDYTVYVYTENGWVQGELPLDLPYLRFTPTQDSTFTFTKSSYASQSLEVKYSIDGGAWRTMDSDVATPVPAGSYVVFKSNFQGKSGNYVANGTFSATGNFNVTGNAMSLIYGDEFENEVSLYGKPSVFNSLFKNCTKLKSVSNSVLPATTLDDGVYYSMFSGCTGLTSIMSALPAKYTSARCYSFMFSGCTGLSSIPSGLLPATIITGDEAYAYMFQNCHFSTLPSGLLNATDLRGYRCYKGMFSGTWLSYLPSGLLPATTLTKYCYESMFQNCQYLSSVPANLLPATTLAPYCYQSMFYDTYSLSEVPTNLLPATTLADYCYCMMFHNSNIRQMPDLPATTLANCCYKYMFRSSKIVSGSVLPAENISSYSSCYEGMFRSCTYLKDPPVIKAKYVGSYGMRYMFNGCSGMNYLVCDILDEPVTSKTYEWLSGVSSNGTFYKNPEATWDQTITPSSTTVPSTWTITTVQQEPAYVKFTTVDDNGSTYAFSMAGLEYSIDGGTWTTLAANTNTPNVPKNSNIRFRGNLVDNTVNGIGKFSSSGTFNVEGNIMTLLYGQYYSGSTYKFVEYTFRYLFGNSSVVDASQLILPSITKNYCYMSMFHNCTSLTAAPELPATTLSQGCYDAMFQDCTSLTTAPCLPSTKLTNNCYSYMFKGCSNLNYVKAMFLEVGNLMDINNWLVGVSATGTFVKNVDATWTSSSYIAPSGWTIETASQ